MATASSPSPRPVSFATSPSPQAHFTAIIATSPSPSSSSSSHHHHATSPTPPPRPPSSPGISVFAPRPMRIPMYRPQFSRPVFLYDSESVDSSSKENTQSTAGAATSTRRSSVASTGIPEEGLDSKLYYNPPKDVLDELFKIIRPTSASSASTTSTQPPSTSSPSAAFIRPYPYNPRTPTNSHRRNPSDASDGGLSGILNGLTVLSNNPRASPDAVEWRTMRTAVSPVARRAINPMIRDPSFQGESQKKE